MIPLSKPTQESPLIPHLVEGDLGTRERGTTSATTTEATARASTGTTAATAITKPATAASATATTTKSSTAATTTSESSATATVAVWLSTSKVETHAASRAALANLSAVHLLEHVLGVINRAESHVTKTLEVTGFTERC